MSFITDTFFGGAERDAAAQQVQSFEQAQAQIAQAAEQARGQAIPLFGGAQQAGQQGFQSALDIFGQTVPQQLQALQGGNVGAQQTLLAGLDPQMAAILGGNINLSGLQPQTLALPDFSTFQQQLPQFSSINDLLGLNPQQDSQGGGSFFGSPGFDSSQIPIGRQGGGGIFGTGSGVGSGTRGNLFGQNPAVTTIRR